MSRNAHPAGPRHGDVRPEAGVSAPATQINAIERAIWPLSAERVDGTLTLGGIAVTELVVEHGTPAIFLDEADVRTRAREYAGAFAGADVYYAGKAFLCTAVARWIQQEGLGLDVCTGGELAVALAADFPTARITLHGNNKSAAELRRAVEVGVGHVVLDSSGEIDQLAAIAAEHGVVQDVLVRVTVGVEAHTHEFIATAHEDQKFGFSLRDGAAEAAIAQVLAAPIASSGRAALAHRLADLRHRRFRGRGSSTGGAGRAGARPARPAAVGVEPGGRTRDRLRRRG